MVCYINRGIILEQAICALLKDYFAKLSLDNKYKNFNISVTNEHPFADLYLYNSSNAQDSFPAIIVSTQEDKKPENLSELIQNTFALSIDENDLNEIIKTQEEKKDIPGLCTVIDNFPLNEIKKTIEKQGECFGWAVRSRRKDNIGIEIWAENNQLKNELYEQVRLFILSHLRFLLADKYSFFDIAIFDNTIQGHRSNNYNFDFDVALSGSYITFDVDYCIEQIILNTELTKIEFNLITEAKNYVKTG